MELLYQVLLINKSAIVVVLVVMVDLSHFSSVIRKVEQPKSKHRKDKKEESFDELPNEKEESKDEIVVVTETKAAEDRDNDKKKSKGKARGR